MYNNSCACFLEGVLSFLKAFNNGFKYFPLYSHAIVLFIPW